jgi:murein DD-endopeptidase MepM/ murein hydrolase activator NlpD
VFDSVNEALCQVPLSIQMGVILPPLLTMPAGWDYRHGTGLQDYLKKGVNVKAPVGDDVITRVAGKQSLSLGNVVALASGKP